MAVPLLRTKLYIPPVRTEWVPRSRLIQQLNAGLNRQLTLISAPAGFGKTTLLIEWIHAIKARHASPRQVAWVSLDEDDNDPVRFWAYFVTALQSVQVVDRQDTLAMLRSPQPVPIQTFLTGLINEIAAVTAGRGAAGRPFILILDDFHVIEAQPVHDGLVFLLDHAPPKMHLAVAGRADPPLPLARLRARGQITELRQADLRFTLDEATDFLNEVMGLGLSEKQTAALEARTEGWIAGLQLAALSMRGRQDVARFIDTFSGSHRYVIDYLADEVLARQPDEIRVFLHQTAILDRLTAPLCDAVTDRNDGRAMLAQLEKANLFLIPLDDHRAWYRYHHLFADLLRASLQQAQPDQVPQLHRRAAAWYEGNGLFSEAVSHALAAEDFSRAANLIEQSTGEMIWMRGEVATLLGWLEALPEELVRSQPGLCLAHAWAAFLSVQFETVAARAQDAERALQSASLTEDVRQSAEGQLAVIQAMLANFQGDIPRTIELSRQALQRLPEDNLLLRAALAGNLGGAYVSAGDIAAASEAFAEAARLYQATGNAFVTLLATGYLGQAQAALGLLRQAAETYRQTLTLAAERGMGLSLVTRLAHVGLARLLYEWNDLDAATCHLTLGVERGQQQADMSLGPGPQVLVDGYTALARVYQAQGNVKCAQDVLQQAEQWAQQHPSLQPGQVAATQARLWLAQGNLSAAARWAQTSGLDADNGPRHEREFEQLTLARVLIAQDRLDEALRLLTRLAAAAEVGQRVGAAIESLTLQALALQAQGDLGQALARLEQALALAEPEGYVRIFVDEGPPTADLLRQATSHYVSSLLSVFDVSWSEIPLHLRTQPLVESLSPRELEVLRLIADGLSNREIAEELVIAVTTVKKHASNIYGKLGVTSRTQALTRAQELGLL